MAVALATSFFVFSIAAPDLQAAEKLEQLSPKGYVNDFAKVIDSQSHDKITALAEELDRKADAQLAVVTIHTLEGDSAADFANRLFEKWGVGPKGKDRGVMVLLAVDDHKYWTEVGYGLEPILPDGKVGGFGRQMLPLLRQNQYGSALLQISTQIALTIAEDKGVTLSQGARTPPPTSTEPSGSSINGLEAFLIFLFLIFVGGRLLALLFALGGWNRRRRGYGGWWIGPTGGWSGGGWGGSGGGGGFGGFGGGASGGGGAGGSW